MFRFRMNNICDNRQASKGERFHETGREIKKTSLLETLSQIPVAREDCQIVETAFHPFKRQFSMMCRDQRRVYFVYMAFIEIHPSNHRRCTKEQPYTSANQNLF